MTTNVIKKKLEICFQILEGLSEKNVEITRFVEVR